VLLYRHNQLGLSCLDLIGVDTTFGARYKKVVAICNDSDKRKVSGPSPENKARNFLNWIFSRGETSEQRKFTNGGEEHTITRAICKWTEEE